MSDKVKFPLDDARAVAEALVFSLKDSCERIMIAGSIRREKRMVGDIEIVYIPKYERRPVPGDMFALKDTSLADLAIHRLMELSILDLRENANGHISFGDKNKLMRHIASGVPVDLFATTKENWFNYLVCRTGPADLNKEICMRAQKMGAKWNPYGCGFTDKEYTTWPMHSEEDVFKFVGLPYSEPKDRK